MRRHRSTQSGSGRLNGRTRPIGDRHNTMNGHGSPAEPDNVGSQPPEVDRPPRYGLRHPADLADPVAVVTDHAAEVADPEINNQLTARMGLAMQSVEFKALYGADGMSGDVGDAARGRETVRAGAYELERLDEGRQDRELIAATSADKTRIGHDRDADAAKAKRIADDIAERIDPRLARIEAELSAREQQRPTLVAQLAEVRDDAPGAPPQDEAPRTPRKIVPLLGKHLFVSAKKTIAVFALELAAAALTLAGILGRLTVIDLPYGNVLLAIAVGASMLAAAAAAGTALATTRWPIKRVAALLWLLFVAALGLWLYCSERLRESKDVGLVVLTISTGFTAYLAMFTAYAHAVFRDADEEREDDDVRRRAGSPLQDAVEALERHDADTRELVDERDSLREEKTTLLTKIEELNDSASRKDAAVAARQGETDAAEARETLRDEQLEGRKRQEAGSTLQAIATSRAMWRFLQEEPPLPAPVPPVGSVGAPGAPTTDRTPADSSSLMISVGCLAGSGLAAVATTTPLIFGAGAAAACLVLLRSLLAARRQRVPAEPNAGLPDASPRIRPAAEIADRRWRRLPERTRPKYGYGSNAPVDHA